MPLLRRTFLLAEGFDDEPSELQKPPVWFKKKLHPEVEKTIDQHFKSQRDPVVVARLEREAKARGEKGGAEIRTVIARRRARNRQLPSSQQHTALYPTGKSGLSKTQINPAQASIRPAPPATSPRRRKTQVLPALARTKTGERLQLDWVNEPIQEAHRRRVLLPRTPAPVIARRQRARSAELTDGPRAGKELTARERLAKTDIIHLPSKVSDETPSQAEIRRKRLGKTEVLPALRATESLDRTPLLTELVTSAGVFASGLNPGDAITSSTPRDQRDLPPNKRRDGHVIGHTANTGAWVPDKEKRKIAPPKSEIPKGVWDPITKELEAQPSNTGGVLTLTRGRPKLIGG